MAELLSPGVFIEEKPAALQVVGPVSTSTAGFVGYTSQGPQDEAVLVTSFEQFVSIFGEQVKDSFTYLSMAAYFANGGRRAYVVRVVPSDATSSTAKILSNHDASVGSGDGVTVAFDSDPAPDNLTALVAGTGYPIRGTTIGVRWRGLAAAPVGPINTKQRASAGTTLNTTIAGLVYEGRLDPAHVSISAFFSGSLPIEPDLYLTGASVVLGWDASGVPKTLTLATVNGPYLTGTNGAGSTATLDRRTGIFSLKIIVGEAPTTADPITATYTPAVGFTATSDNAGTLTSAGFAVATNQVNLTTGRIRFTTTAPGTPLVGSPILVSYTLEAWSLTPVSKGTWSNKLRMTISGNADFYVGSTNSYTKFNVNVFLEDSTGASVLKEAFEEVSFADPNDANFFSDVLTDLSDFIVVGADGSNEAPLQLGGVARSTVLAGGTAVAPAAITTAIGKTPIAPRTVTITYTDDATSLTKTITDNGNGVLIGDVSGSTNTIDYATGAIVFTPATAIKSNSLVAAEYRSRAAETTHVEQFGDTSKSYTAGTDGTFTSLTYGRNQFTAPALQAQVKGMFALDRVEELLQVVIPDFAGDTTVTGDMLDYADSRASLPSGGDRFVILTVPKGSSPQEAVDWFRFELARSSKFAALYWPWVLVADPLSNNRSLAMPPMGHIAGIYARTDVQRNVAKSPAGTIDGKLNFLAGLEYLSTQGERDLVYPNKINPLISTTQTGGPVVWGARTISNDSQWRFVSVRRLFMFLERSVYNATWWIPFENNGPALWAKVKAQLNSFMLAQFNAGLFAGNSPNDAFNVVCDETNNSAATIEQGRVIVDVAAAPFKPAEFVSFRFSQIFQNS